jgi:hypothetical protein
VALFLNSNFVSPSPLHHVSQSFPFINFSLQAPNMHLQHVSVPVLPLQKMPSPELAIAGVAAVAEMTRGIAAAPFVPIRVYP